MYPTRLNLLSQEKQTFLQKLVLAQYIKHVLEMIVAVLCVCGIILLSGQNLLDKHFYSLMLNSVSFSNQQATKNRGIMDLNRSIIKVENLQKEYTLWTPMLISISNALPDGISLTGIEFSRTSKTANFTGLAKNREDLLNLKNNFGALPQIESIDIPITQFTEKENIPLSFQVRLK